MNHRKSTTDHPTHPPSAAGVAEATAPDADDARRGVLTYLAAVIVLSGAVQAIIIATHDLSLSPLLMWMPALASVVVRLVRNEGFADVSFSFGGRRTWVAILLVFFLPFVVGFVAYGIAWATGLAVFAPPETLPLFGDQSGARAAARFVLLVVAALLRGLVPGLAFAAGEEIGWRGYLVLRLIDAQVPFAIVVSGVIWGLWHVPLILAGLYVAGPNPLFSAGVFMVSITALSVPLAWARLATGSVWPAVALHGFWNIVIQSIFDQSTGGPGAVTWTGESGLLTAATLVVIAVTVARQHWPILRTPPASSGSTVAMDLQGAT